MLILWPKEMPDLWFETSYVSTVVCATYVTHTTVEHLLRYLVSKAAVKLPLSPDS